MPKRISSDELKAIAAVIGCHPDGLAADAVRKGLSFAPPTRTLQRRLAHPEASERIRTSGTGKGKHYFPVPGQSVEGIAPSNTEAGAVTTHGPFQLSPAAREIRKIVSRPRSARTPVGYDVEFLKGYRPNETFYLPLATRERLAELGQVGITDLPAGTYLRQILNRLLIDLAWNSSRLEGNTYYVCGMSLSGPTPARPSATMRCGNPSAIPTPFVSSIAVRSGASCARLCRWGAPPPRQISGSSGMRPLRFRWKTVQNSLKRSGLSYRACTRGILLVIGSVRVSLSSGEPSSSGVSNRRNQRSPLRFAEIRTHIQAVNHV